MSSFDSYSTGPAVHDKGMTATAHEASEEEAAKDPLFSKCFNLVSLWHSMPGTIPHYSQITPKNIGSALLPYLFILDVISDEDAELDFRWRLFGTAIRQRYGIEATGHTLSGAKKLDASIGESIRLARLVYLTHQPRFMRTQFDRNNVTYHQARTVILPLSDDNGSVSRLFGCTTWSR